MKRLAVLALLAGAACGGADSDGGAVDAFVEMTDMARQGQWDRLYAVLHPEQQALIDRATYVRCAAESPWQFVEGVRVVETYDGTVDIPGGRSDIDATRITARVSFGDETITETFSSVDVDGEWRFVATMEPDGPC